MLATRPALVIALLCDAAAATTPGPTPGPTPSSDKLMPQDGTCRRWGHPEAGEWNKDSDCCAIEMQAEGGRPVPRGAGRGPFAV